jgi:hypothetical protein
MSRLPTLILLISFGAFVHADDYWVLGSFAERAVAEAEGERISFSTGIEVLLQESHPEDGPRYRLLTGVRSEISDREMLLYQLSQAGIEEPWTLVLEADESAGLETVFADLSLYGEFDEAELAEIDAMLESMDELEPYVFETGESSASAQGPVVTYLVAGSFELLAGAEAFAEPLRSIREDVTIRAAAVGSTIYHRVMVGPVPEEDESAFRVSLADEGLTDVWAVRMAAPADVTEVPPPGQQDADEADQSLEIGGPRRGLRIPGRPGVTPMPGGRDTSGYNPARLRKSGGFPEPRR